MDETSSSTPAPESTPAPAAGATEQQQPQLDNPPKRPSFEPAPGTRHVFDPKRGYWMVERDDRDAAPSREEERVKQPTPDAKPGTADETGGLQLAEHLPPAIRNDPQASEHLAEVSTALDDVRMEAGAKQRLVDLAMELHTADLNTGMPALWNREANEGVLRQRWGAAYDERVARAQAAAKALGPKFLAWCDRTQAGNSPALLETLALMADKDKLLSLSPEQAAAKMKEWRSDPKSPLRNSLHPEHAVALAKARVLAILSEGKGRQGNVDEMVADRTAKETSGDSPEAKLDADIQSLRLNPAYFDSSRPEHKSVVARMQELMRQRWPD